MTYVSYLIATKIGVMMALPDSISPVWPASGVALAMTLRFGNRAGVAIFAAFLTAQLLWPPFPTPLGASLGAALSATIEPMLSAYLLRRFAAFDSALPRFRDVVALMLLGASVGPLLNSLFTILLFATTGSIPWPQFWPAMETFWLGNAGGVLMLSAATLVWLERPAKPSLDSAALIEAGIIFGLLSIIVLGLQRLEILQHLNQTDAVAFLCFPLVAWASIRLDLRLSSAITLLLAIESIVVARWGIGPFRYGGPETAILVIQLLILSLNVTNQLLGGLARQKDVAEETLRDREEFLSLAVHGSNDGLFDFHRATRHLWLSPRWKEQLGYEDKELPNQLETWERLILPEDRQTASALFAEIDRGQATHSDCMMRFRHKQGHIAHILCRLSVRRDENGHVMRLVGTHTDLTDLINAREELEHQTASLTRLARDLNLQRREAEAANEAKSAFLATVSHEVRTPLNGVIGMLSLLLDTPLESDQRRYGNTALASAEELLIIINDILDVSKLEAGCLTLDIIDCDLPALVEGIVALFSARAASKGISLSAEIDGNVPRHIRSDPTRLRQILMNLVGNAVKFTQAGDVVIRLKCLERQGDELAAETACVPSHNLVIDVADTGIGIASSQIEHLFERFRQADDSITRRFGGTGLGLTISKQLIELMGGLITVTSELGIGSTFQVILPCIESTASTEAGTSSAFNGAKSFEPCHVLVVEDNAVNRALVTEMLSRAGHRVTTVENGRAALAAVARDHFDIIVMDVQMPEVDGVTAMQWIRERDDNRAQTPIIALTADTMTGSRERFMAAGFSDYLEKPVRAVKLLETISRHLSTANGANNGGAGARLPEWTQQSPAPRLVTTDTSEFAALSDRPRNADFRHMVNTWAGDIQHDLRRLHTAIDLGDYDACQHALESLATDAQGIGASSLADLARHISATADNVETIFAWLSRVQSVAERVITRLTEEYHTDTEMKA
ncbi:ATP-binding protein [Dongia soli]|uniref:histidine kinase n=1 Tax=Dongia soli TaxID=600628 RepID=A0ABU5E710_9PROT|nr:ATP-binding protein [Dongia soli]MDY0881343.1 ATP-binding protein [Dongia soli]